MTKLERSKKIAEGIPTLTTSHSDNFRIIVAASGSKGNCIVIESPAGNVMIDAGIPRTELRRRLKSVGATLHEPDVMVITHSHADHAAYAEEFHPKRKLPEGIAVSRFPVPHDVECWGYAVTCGGKKIVIATDLGHVPEDLRAHALDANVIMIESNYDRAMLNVSGRPEEVKARIASKSGHLSNEQAAAIVDYCSPEHLEWIVLLHISQDANSPQAAYNAMSQALEFDERGINATVTTTFQDKTVIIDLDRKRAFDPREIDESETPPDDPEQAGNTEPDRQAPPSLDTPETPREDIPITHTEPLSYSPAVVVQDLSEQFSEEDEIIARLVDSEIQARKDRQKRWATLVPHVLRIRELFERKQPGTKLGQWQTWSEWCEFRLCSTLGIRHAHTNNLLRMGRVLIPMIGEKGIASCASVRGAMALADYAEQKGSIPDEIMKIAQTESGPVAKARMIARLLPGNTGHFDSNLQDLVLRAGKQRMDAIKGFLNELKPMVGTEDESEIIEYALISLCHELLKAQGQTEQEATGVRRQIS